MQLGLVGLGRMGGNMRERLRAAGHEVIGYDNQAELSDVASLAEMAKKLDAPRAVWVMVPAAVTDETITKLIKRHGRREPAMSLKLQSTIPSQHPRHASRVPLGE